MLHYTDLYSQLPLSIWFLFVWFSFIWRPYSVVARAAPSSARRSIPAVFVGYHVVPGINIWASCSKACSISPALLVILLFDCISFNFYWAGLICATLSGAQRLLPVILQTIYAVPWIKSPLAACKNKYLNCFTIFLAQNGFFLVLFLSFGSHPVIHTQQCTYNLDLPSRSHCGRLRGPFGILGSNPGQLHARQASYP